jgi:hypothetical protein
MTSKETVSESEVITRANWGDSSIECATNEVEIRDLLRKKWPIKAIWRKLTSDGSVTVKYEAFRKAALRLNTGNDQTIPTQVSRPIEARPKTVPDHQPTKLGKPRYASTSIESFKGNFE